MNAPEHLEAGGLRAIIETAAQSEQLGLGDLTVMSALTDPYRLDVPAKHRDAAWLAQAWRKSGARQGLHLRGLHYALVSISPPIEKPDGTPYLNSHDDWTWLQQAANYARWLDYFPFYAIVDERNAAPIINTDCVIEREVSMTRPLQRPDIDSFDRLLPWVATNDWTTTQAYRLVLIGEKQSLASVLRPLSFQYRAELVLPTGELSTTLLHGVVRRAAGDGRPCRIFYFSDFDPTGWHMPIEVSRKVQALINLQFPELDIQVRRCALTHEQVRTFNLPSTPLKETERRADKWRKRWGVEQTEIDALATLRPDELRRIVEEALDPYIDHRLADRTRAARAAFLREARTAIDEVAGRYGNELGPARGAYEIAAAALTNAHAEVVPVLEKIRDEAARQVELIKFDAPEPEPEGDVDEPLFSSSDDWTTATRKLIEAKL